MPLKHIAEVCRELMKTILKWLLIAIGGALGIALLGVATVFVLIGRDLDRTFDRQASSVDVPTDEASITEGARLARLRGCYGGCHGESTAGAVFFDAPDGTRVVAPDLGLMARNYSTAELERVIRHGIRPDGTSVLVAMPSAMLHSLSDRDLGAIIAFLRSQPPGDEPLPETRVGPLARLFLFDFKRSLGTILAAEYIEQNNSRTAPLADDAGAPGRYLAMTVCSECHGTDLRGGPDEFAPTLAVVTAYSPENFRRLMREGMPIGDRELDLMARVAVSRFQNFTDSEIDRLHEYLQTLAATAPDP